MVSLYNAERFVAGLISDLLNQTILRQMEILVVDAASPERERDIVQAAMHGLPWVDIAYHRTETRETCAATTNTIVRAARGKYLTMANADDRHDPRALGRLVEVLEQHPEKDLAYADCAVTETENQTLLTTTAIVDHFRWPDFDPAALFDRCFVGPQPVYRRSMHDRFGLYDETLLANDYEFYLRCVSQGASFIHVPEVLGLYLRSRSGIEHSNQEWMSLESQRAREQHWPVFNRRQAACAAAVDRG